MKKFHKTAPPRPPPEFYESLFFMCFLFLRSFSFTLSIWFYCKLPGPNALLNFCSSRGFKLPFVVRLSFTCQNNISSKQKLNFDFLPQKSDFRVSSGQAGGCLGQVGILSRVGAVSTRLSNFGTLSNFVLERCKSCALECSVTQSQAIVCLVQCRVQTVHFHGCFISSLQTSGDHFRVTVGVNPGDTLC